MPFYSRHSDDGRDRFLGGIHDEDDYHDFMNMLFMNSSFADDIERHYKSSDADVLPSPTDSEETKENKEKQYQKDYHKKYFQEKLNKHYTCNICGKSMANSSNKSRHEKSRKCQSIKSKV